VVSAILATEHHFDDTEYSNITTNLLLDMDLMAFQDDYEIFLKTQKEIDKEFLPFHAEEEVIDKRKKFLQNILENQTLRYRVIDPHGTLKGKAYRNIETYLNNGD
jgi:predicted metal-dependent HD superfamily phosphohydrolase